MAQASIPVHLTPEETLTGEAVALDVQPLGFFLRAVGALIDVVSAVVLLLICLLVGAFLADIGALSSDVLPIVSIVVLVMVMVVVPTTVETVTRGRSLGRLAVGGRIVRSDGGASGFRQAFLRALAGVLEIWFTLGAVAAVVGAFTPRAQRLGDLLAGTYSERTRTRPLPDAAPGVPPELATWAEVADVSRLPDRLAARMAQFLRQAPHLAPPARSRLATTLAGQALPHVSPQPAVDPETLLRAVAAVRREREWRALTQEDHRVAGLLAGSRETLR